MNNIFMFIGATLAIPPWSVFTSNHCLQLIGLGFQLIGLGFMVLSFHISKY